MTSWTVTNNYKETARDLELPVTTVKSVVDNNKDKPEFVKLRNEKMNEFSNRAWVSELCYDLMRLTGLLKLSRKHIS